MQTWDPHPARVLPMESDATLGGLVGRYLLPRTRIEATRSAGGVQGRLVDAAGRPVAGAHIRVQAIGADPSRPLPVRTVSGIVPPNARFAILGMRVNTECDCDGANDLFVGDLTYLETAGGSARQSYSMPAEAARLQAGAKGSAVDPVGCHRRPARGPSCRSAEPEVWLQFAAIPGELPAPISSTVRRLARWEIPACSAPSC